MIVQNHISSTVVMSAPRHRRGTREGAEGGGKGGGQLLGKEPSGIVPAKSSPSTFSITSLLTHLSLLAFYLTVHVWGSGVMAGLRERGLYFPESQTTGKHWKFVTVLNLRFQTVYFALAVITDLMPVQKVKVKLEALCDYLFTTVGFPLSLVVAVGFWGIISMHHSFMYHERSADIARALPPLLNHCWHTAVAVGVLMEILLVFHRYPSTSTAIMTIFTYHFGYATCVFLLFYFADALPYPFLRLMGPIGMAIFFLLTFPITLLFYYIGKGVSYLRWGAR